MGGMGRARAHFPLVALASLCVTACSPGIVTSAVSVEVSVSVVPDAVTLAPGGSQQFSATVTGGTDASVTWTIDEGSVAGSVSATGSFQASQTGGVYHVRATSRADASRSAAATVTVTPAPGAPVIASFAAAPTSILLGQGSTLSWSVTDATSLTIDNGVGSVTGQTSKQVMPAANTTYMLTATNAAGSSTALATVTVATVAVSVAPMTATVAAGGSQQLSATVTGSSDTTVLWTIDEGSVAGAVSAAGLYQASQTGGVYHVRATSRADSSRSAAATVTVMPEPGAPVIASFAAAPAAIVVGQSSTLGWSVTGATSLSIDNGVGSVTGLSSKQVMPAATTTYVLTATNAAGSVTATAKVTVTTKPTITSFTANPTSINAGQSSTLRWSVTGATSLSIDNAVGSVTGLTSTPVTPAATTTYTLTATNAAGSVTATAQVSVTNKPMIASFAATPPTINPGQSSTLSWSVTGATSLSIDNGVGSVTGQSSTPVMPAATTTYTLTASNGTDNATATTTVTVTTGTGGLFPLSASANSRYLQSASGAPFPILGRAAWFAISLGSNDRATFLNDTVGRGYDAIEVTILTHDSRGNNPPHDGNGDLPFLKRLDGGNWSGALSYGNIGNEAPDFSTPNEAYWAFVDGFLSTCEDNGVLVLMFPSYTGYKGSAQGWMAEMEANGTGKMQQYGAYLATRYQNQPNIVWMMGGDMGTGGNSYSAGQSAVEGALIAGLKSVAGQSSTQFSAEWDSSSICTDQGSFGGNCTLEGVYSFTGQVATYGRMAYGHSPTMPTFLLEEPYDEEGPDGLNFNPNATQPVRRFQWWGWLSAIGGYMSGNGYVWPFTSGWQSHLNTQGAQDMARLNGFIRSIAWYALVPSGLGGMKTLVTAGGSSPSATDYVAAAATPAGDLLVAYVPPDHGGNITIDMTAMAAAARARWFNPTSAAYTLIGTISNAGPQAFTPPGNNGTGSSDWVLVLDTP